MTLAETINQLLSIKSNLIKQGASAASKGGSSTAQQQYDAISEIIGDLQAQEQALGTYSTNYLNITNSATDAQSYAYELINDELKNSNITLTLTKQQIANNIRQVEINNYYNQQFLDRTNIVKTVIVLCIPIIILAYLYKSGYISQTVMVWIVCIIIVLGIIYLWGPFIRALSHNSIVYDQYNWNFNKENAPHVDLTNPTGTTQIPTASQNTGQCLISKPTFSFFGN